MKQILSKVNMVAILFMVSCFFSTTIIAAKKSTKKTSSKKRAKSKSKSPIEFSARVELASLGNIFRMDDAGELKYNSGDPDYVTSKRYDEMNALDDFVISPSVQISGPFTPGAKRPLNYSLEVAYNIYTTNTLASHPEFELELDKKLSKNMWISLETELSLLAFRKNYLSGDNSPDANITKDEKEYSHGIYSEFEPTLTLKIRVFEGNNKKAFSPRIDIEPFIGYHMRWFEDPFSNRDRQGILPGVNFIFNFARKWELELGYTYGAITSPAEDELDVINNARIIHKIDRARTEHYFNAGITVDLTKKIEMEVAYEMRSLEYLTDNKADEGNYQRTQTRSTIEFEFEYKLKNDWRVGAGISSTTYADTNTIDTSKYSQLDILGFVQKDF